MTMKQKKFCEYYIGKANFNATKAAIMAGYSEKTACVLASETLRKPYVKEYIDKRKSELVKNIRENHLQTLRNLVILSSFNIQDLYDESGDLKRISELPRDVAFALLSAKMIRRKDGEEYDTLDEVKTESKLKAIEMLAKIQKLYEDSVVGDVTINVKIEKEQK